MIWGYSTVGRTSLPYFIPKTVKVGQTVNGESAQNSSGIFGALAQLVERTISNYAPHPLAVIVESAQNSAGIFGALAQLVARDIRIVEASGSNPLCSTQNQGISPWFFLYPFSF
jgi:hypothetical protein